MKKNSKSNNLQSLGNMVYSTNREWTPQEEEDDTASEIAPGKQLLYIGRQSKHRAGKTVTLVSGFTGTGDALNELCTILKKKCGIGGSSKDGEIILQGDCREKTKIILEELGYKTRLK